MLDYKNIIITRVELELNHKEMAEKSRACKSDITDFIRAFESCEKLFPEFI